MVMKNRLLYLGRRRDVRSIPSCSSIARTGGDVSL